MPEIVINLKSTSDTSGFARTEAASVRLNKTVGDLGTKLGKMFSGQQLGSAIATAVGINVNAISDKIARFATSMSEVEEEAYRKIESLSERAAELGLKNTRSRQSGEQQLYVAIRDRNRLQFEVENSTAKTAVEQEELLRKRIRLEERVAEIHKLQSRNTPEIQAQAELAKIALRAQTLSADENQTEYQKKSLTIDLLSRELAVRTKLIDITKNAKLENGETEPDRIAKLDKLEAENQQLRNRINFLQFGSREAMSAREDSDRFAEFNEDQKGSNTSVRGSARAGAENWIVSLGSNASQIATTIEQTIGGAVAGITAGIMGWFEGAQTFGQLAGTIGRTVLANMLQTVVQMGAQWLLNAALIKTGMLSIEATGDALRVGRVAKENAAEAATLPAKTAGAAASGISSFGVALAFGLIAVALIAGLAGGFADGGYTPGGPKNKPAGVVHAGEWVAPQWMVKHAGFGKMIAGLEGARNGGGFDPGALGGLGSSLTRPGYSQPAAERPVINILMDPAQFARLQQEHSGQWFEDMSARHMRRNA